MKYMIKKHWNLNYILSKLKVKLYEYQYPQAPWLTSTANEILDELLSPSDIALEYGSGRSTLWISKRVRTLTSIEDNSEWFTIVSEQLAQENQKNIQYLLLESSEPNNFDNEYCRHIDSIQDNSIDFILVDGSHRNIIAEKAIDKVKIGGLLVLDNANWYLPHKTYSPTSIGINGNPTEEWKSFYNKINSWRLIWTTNGVTDTAIFIKK